MEVRATIGFANENRGPRRKYRYQWSNREQRAVPVAIDSPPSPPQVIEANRYVPYETSHFQNAYTWAAAQVARKLPAAVETLTTLDSLIEQQLNAREDSGVGGQGAE